MAYETGAAATVDAVLQKISTFALGLGYTINRDTAVTNGRELCIYHADAGYFNFISNNVIQDFQGNITNPTPNITSYASTGYDVSAINAQPGTSLGSLTNGLPPDFHKYYLFGTTEYIHCVIEIQPGLFAHLGCGMMEKAWNYAGGEYIHGTYWNHSYNYIHLPTSYKHAVPLDSCQDSGLLGTHLRLDIEGVSPRWFNGNRSEFTNVFVGCCMRRENYANIISFHWSDLCSPSSISGVSVLMPIVMGVILDSVSDKHYIAGKIKDVRLVNIELMTAGQTITYGTDEWMVFPMKKKQLSTVVAPELSSGVNAYAYRKIV